MFTGVVAAVGRIAAAAPARGGARLRVEAGGLPMDDVAVGDSIAVNGVCLTVVALDRAVFEADVSLETLDCTAGFPTGARVNLEKALRLSDDLRTYFQPNRTEKQVLPPRKNGLSSGRHKRTKFGTHVARTTATRTTRARRPVPPPAARLPG